MQCPYFKGKYSIHFYGVRCSNSDKVVEIDDKYLPSKGFKSSVRNTIHYRDKYVNDRCLCDFKSCQIYKN
jgi:hypothetical protein